MRVNAKSAYLVFTPYHFLLACGLASMYDCSDRKFLIIIGNFEDAHKLIKVIQSWKANPFSKMLFIKGWYDGSPSKEKPSLKDRIISKIVQIKQTRARLRKLKSFFLDNLKGKCYLHIFNDTTIEGQLLAFLNSKYGGVNFYVEDGAAAYSSSIFKWIEKTPFYKRLLNKVVYKFIYGTYYDTITVIGTYKYIHKIKVLYPEFIRPELKSKVKIRISNEVFKYLYDSRLAKLWLNCYEINNIIDDNAKVDLLIIIPHSEFLMNHGLMDKYKQIIVDVLNKANSMAKNVYIKYHPREDRYDYLKITNFNSTILPNVLPSELIYLNLVGREPDVVLGDVSTALITAKILLKRTRVYSIMNLLGICDQHLEDVFTKFGILPLQNVSEIFTHRDG